jgi:hypothetical protein
MALVDRCAAIGAWFELPAHASLTGSPWSLAVVWWWLAKDGLICAYNFVLAMPWVIGKLPTKSQLRRAKLLRKTRGQWNMRVAPILIAMLFEQIAKTKRNVARGTDINRARLIGAADATEGHWIESVAVAQRKQAIDARTISLASFPPFRLDGGADANRPLPLPAEPFHAR